MKKLGTRWVNKKNFSRLGMVTATFLVLTQLIYMAISGFFYKSYTNGNIFELVLDCISLIFYFIVLNNYRMSENNLYQGYFATLLIIISDYIFPLIMSLIGGIFSLQIVVLSIPIILLVVYFVFLTIENKKRDAKSCNALKIIGIITAVVTIIPGVYDLYNTFASIATLSSVDVATVFNYIGLVLNGMARTIGLPLIFAFYPFVLYKERYL